MNNGKYQCECKRQMKYCVCEDYALDFSICACKFDKIVGLMNTRNIACAESLIGDLKIAFNETQDTTKTASINSNYNTIKY